ncbi:MAG: polysaccharide deacetylase family protein [Actinomycetota bacterium]
MTRGRRALKAAARFSDRIRPRRLGVVVLCYHRVGADTGSEVDLPPDLFDAQLTALAASGRVCRLGDALERLAGAGPTDGVVLTFDDGSADFVDHVVPALVRHGLPATLYLATGAVGPGANTVSGGMPLSWSALADAVTTGLVDVGSHTHGHLLLDRADPDPAAVDLDRSISLITEHLGRVPIDFAYPKAVAPSAANAEAVRRRFRSAALAGTRANVVGRTDPYRLARSPVQVSDGMRYFTAKATGGMALEDDLRRIANRVRYAGART